MINNSIPAALLFFVLLNSILSSNFKGKNNFNLMAYMPKIHICWYILILFGGKKRWDL